MGTKDLLSEKEVLKKLAKEEKDKKKNKKARRDAWTAVAIIAIIMLVAVGLSFYKTNNIDIKEYSGRSLAKEHERRETTKNVIIGLGVICTGVLIIALVNRSKNKTDKLSPEELHHIEERKLNQARERVEEARKNRLNEEAKVTMTRSNRESMHSVNEGHRGNLSDRTSMSMMDMEDREAYLERRKREYQYYMENDLDEDIYDNDDIEEASLSNGRGRSYKPSWKKKLKPFIPYGIGILVAAIIVAVIVILL